MRAAERACVSDGDDSLVCWLRLRRPPLLSLHWPAGIAWRPRPCLAARQTTVARLPRVLCLQLRRGFWSAQGHHVKVTGHVPFPLMLALRRAPLLGHGWACAAGAAGLPQQHPEAPLYSLRAVVVHLGGLAGAGHYTVYRCLEAGAGAAGGGVWVCASDEAVQPASLEQVLGAEASLLLYERSGRGGERAAACDSQ